MRALEAQERAEDSRQREGVATGQDQREEELRPAGDEDEDGGRTVQYYWQVFEKSNDHWHFVDVYWVSTLYADPGPPPPTQQDIATTWVGYVPGWFYRLELRSDGSGALAVSYYSSRASLYHVRNWTLTKNKIDMSLEPVSITAHEYPIQVSGSVAVGGGNGFLHLMVWGEASPRHERYVDMLRETDLLRNLEVTKSRIDER